MPLSENERARCLILACGNTLRSDDGVGPWLATWCEGRFAGEPGVRVIARQQWTPDLAEEIAHADAVVFVDCAIDAAPGTLRIAEVEPDSAQDGLSTHHLGAAELLRLSEEFYSCRPRNALLLTLGAGSTEMGETFSESIKGALPQACKALETAVQGLLRGSLR